MRILALDVATRTGWAFSDDGGRTFVSGWWDLKTRSDESKGMKLIRFRAKLVDFMRGYGVDVIAFERPHGRNVLPIIVESEMHGVMKAWCLESGVEYQPFSGPELKAFATGKGNCNKAAVVDSVQKRWKPTVEDDNEADAIALLHLAIDRLALTEGK